MQLPDGIKSVPLICYESVYGTYIAEMVRKQKLNCLLVILNEGWYNNHVGAHQLLKASIARAVENRKAVVRSSNRGISAFIQSNGKVQAQMDTFEAGALRQKIMLNTATTFYMQSGDFIGWLCTAAIPLLLLWTLVFRTRQPRKRNRIAKR